MNTNDFIKADEISLRVGVSKGQAYKIIRMLNEELNSQGYLTFSGKTSREYFNERMYKGRRNDHRGGDSIASI